MDTDGFFVIFLETVNRVWLTGLSMVSTMGMESFFTSGRSLASCYLGAPAVPSLASDSAAT